MDKKKGFIIFLIAVVILFGVSCWFVRTDRLSVIFSKNPGDCLVLSSRYCDTGKETYREPFRLLGFNLPKNTYIYAPFSGTLIVSGASLTDLNVPSQGTIQGDKQTDGTSMTFFFFSEYAPLAESGSAVKKGQKIAKLNGMVMDGINNFTTTVGFYSTNAAGLDENRPDIIDSFFKKYSQ
jgi:hypothetical protein